MHSGIMQVRKSRGISNLICGCLHVKFCSTVDHAQTGTYFRQERPRDLVYFQGFGVVQGATGTLAHVLFTQDVWYRCAWTLHSITNYFALALIDQEAHVCFIYFCKVTSR